MSQHPPSDLLAHNAVAGLVAFYGNLLMAKEQKIQMLESALRSLTEGSKSHVQDDAQHPPGSQGDGYAERAAPVAQAQQGEAPQAQQGQEEPRNRLFKVGEEVGPEFPHRYTGPGL